VSDKRSFFRVDRSTLNGLRVRSRWWRSGPLRPFRDRRSCGQYGDHDHHLPGVYSSQLLIRPRNNALADRFFANLRDKHDIDDAIVLVDGSASLQRACRKHDLNFRYERHGNRNSAERVFREVKRRTTSFSNCFSNAEAETANEWLRAFAFAWNQLIW